MSFFNILSTGADIISSGADAYVSIKAVKNANDVDRPANVTSKTSKTQKFSYDKETQNAIIKAKQSEVDRNTMINAYLMRDMANDSRLKKDNTLIYIVGGVCALGLILVTINSMKK